MKRHLVMVAALWAALTLLAALPAQALTGPLPDPGCLIDDCEETDIIVPGLGTW